jgi:hypothetical protein
MAQANSQNLGEDFDQKMAFLQYFSKFNILKSVGLKSFKLLSIEHFVVL